jgi:hypothetical protein
VAWDYLTPKSLREIEDGERKWQAKGITNYEIDIHFFTFGADIYAHLVVTNGRITDHTCQRGEMFPDYDDKCPSFNAHPERLDIPELFRTGNAMGKEIEKAEGSGGSPSPFAPSVYLNPIFGFPYKLIQQRPEYTEWNVTSFRKK